MKKLFVISIILLFCMQGCIPLFIGAGVLTGYVLSNDSASGNVKVTYDELWDQCRKTLENHNAEIITIDKARGLIKSKIKGNSVTLHITILTEGIQKLYVSARKYMLPKPQFAQKIFFDVVDEIQ